MLTVVMQNSQEPEVHDMGCNAAPCFRCTYRQSGKRNTHTGVLRHDRLVTLFYAAVEQSQVQSLVLQLHRLGFLRHNPAHKTYQVQPYLRPHLAALAQQQPIALYSPSLLGWCKACLNTCAISTALYSAHAQVCALCSPLVFRSLMLIALSSADLHC